MEDRVLMVLAAEYAEKLRGESCLEDRETSEHILRSVVTLDRVTTKQGMNGVVARCRGGKPLGTRVLG
jgi:hypothetical protein